MTARELIDILNTCDENANLLIEQWDGYIVGIGKVNDYSSNTGEVIIVED